MRILRIMFAYGKCSINGINYYGMIIVRGQWYNILGCAFVCTCVFKVVLCMFEREVQ